jgi:hypothetical protein
MSLLLLFPTTTEIDGILAQAAITFADMSLTGAGTVLVQGSAGMTFADMSLAGAGTVLVKGSAGMTFADMSLAARIGDDGDWVISGTATPVEWAVTGAAVDDAWVVS